MKRVYVTPTMEIDSFVANDYIAACYKIYCETPNNNSSYNRIYWDSNGNGQLDKGDKLAYTAGWGGFTGCGRYHYGVVQGDAPTANGFVTDNWGNSAPVFVWEEHLGGGSIDIHVMNPNGKGYVDISSDAHPNASA